MDVRDLLKNNQSYYEDFVTRAIYNSNALEGSTLTKNETYALTFDSNHCPINANAKEIHQAINHKKALGIMLDRVNHHEPLTEEFLIMENDAVNENILFGGAYREDPAYISGSTKVFPGPEEIESFLQKFINRYNELVESGFTMEDVADLHIQFENIHPFTDGNGRTGRILINSMLISSGQSPIVIPLELRNDYIKMLETNNVKAMAETFRELQKIEEERAENFAGLVGE
ncbi:Fic family protein [Erysipelotrichaceae bacterium RD49]|nr:Fic family protein [Erysipelotrichaceae bacterium RD49]